MLDRLNQATQRGLTYASLTAMGVAAAKLPDQLGRQSIRRNFAQKLVDLRGVPLKVSQVLSMTAGEEDQAIHREAQAKLTPMPLELVKALLEERVPEFSGTITSIAPEGHPASLGQVHWVETVDKQAYAVKIQYPDINRDVHMDEALLGLVTGAFDGFKEGFDLGAYQHYLQHELAQELDYAHERQVQQIIYTTFEQTPNIVIPQSHEPGCGEGVLTMSWEPALDVTSFLAQATPKQCQQAESLITAFFIRCMFEAGYVHADPNEGNFGFRLVGENVQLVVYDYGSVQPVTHEQQIALLKLLEITQAGVGQVVPWLVEMGFDLEMLTPIKDKLLAFCELIFEPWLSQGRYELHRWNRRERAKDILGAERWNFMLAAPPSLLGLMRAVQGLFFYTDKLGQGMYMKPQLTRIRQQWAGELGSALPHQFLSKQSLVVENNAMAQHLHISVTEGSQTKAALHFPRLSIENLEDFVPDDVQEKLTNQGVKLDTLVQKARQHGYAPMDLFSVNNGGKEVRVWLA